MAPKVKVFASKGDNFDPKIPLNKDFINQLPPSTIDKPKGQLLLKGLQVVEGLIDKNYFIKDAKLSYTRWELFYSLFRNRNMGIPVGNPWSCDL